jgi:hypothetical protein
MGTLLHMIFFGLGQPGAIPFHHQHNQHHNQGFNHQGDQQDEENQEMIEEIDEIPDAAPTAGEAQFLPDLNYGLADGLPDLNLQVEILVPYLSFGLSPQNMGAESSDQDDVDQIINEEVVLALQAEPTSFLHLELQSHELNADELYGFASDNVAGEDRDHPSHVEPGQSFGEVAQSNENLDIQASLAVHQNETSAHSLDLGDNSQSGALVVEHGSVVAENSTNAHVEAINSNLQVGRILLPESIEVDPGFMPFQNEGYGYQNICLMLME